MKLRRAKWILLVVLAAGALAVVYPFRHRLLAAVAHRLRGQKTVADRLAEYGPAARARWKPFFAKARATYPPRRVVLAGFKQERVLEVYVPGEEAILRRVRSLAVLGASGALGPKLMEGDRQVPEGVYPVESLNPNSLFHLALRVGYPNEFDRERARQDGRKRLGGDIMIHGSTASIGCLAMGNEAAEDLFVLVADCGLRNVEVILSPVDFRLGRTVPQAGKLPPWCDGLYSILKARLAGLPAAQAP